MEDFFGETVLDRVAAGYVVRNPDLVRKAWHNTGGLVIEAITGGHGGQCGEFARWGVDWTQAFAEQIFGPGVIVDYLVLDPHLIVNHSATRIILPDGRRFMLDYWDAVGRSYGTAPRLVPEQSWIAKWRRELIGPGAVQRSDQEEYLKRYIAKFGEQRGMQAYREEHPRPQKETIVHSWTVNPW